MDIVCTGIVPVPLAVNPDTPVVAVAVQVKVAPITLDVRVTSVVLVPEQTVWVIGVLLTVGAGSTVIVTVCGVPAQLPAVDVGVTVYTTF